MDATTLTQAITDTTWDATLTSDGTTQTITSDGRRIQITSTPGAITWTRSTTDGDDWEQLDADSAPAEWTEAQTVWFTRTMAAWLGGADTAEPTDSLVVAFGRLGATIPDDDEAIIDADEAYAQVTRTDGGFLCRIISTDADHHIIEETTVWQAEAAADWVDLTL